MELNYNYIEKTYFSTGDFYEIENIVKTNSVSDFLRYNWNNRYESPFAFITLKGTGRNKNFELYYNSTGKDTFKILFTYHNHCGIYDDFKIEVTDFIISDDDLVSTESKYYPMNITELFDNNELFTYMLIDVHLSNVLDFFRAFTTFILKHNIINVAKIYFDADMDIEEFNNNSDLYYKALKISDTILSDPKSYK